MSDIIQIKVNDLVPAPDNPRRKAEADKELIASVQEVGILQPLLVEATDTAGKWQILAGERRWKAAVKAKLAEVPCRVVRLNPQERQLFMLIENLHREDLSPVEEAQGYFQAIELGMTKADLAAKLGKTQKHITERLRLIVLPPNAQEAVTRGDLGLSEAVTLADAITSQPELVQDVEAAGSLTGDAARTIAWAAEQRTRAEAVAVLREEVAQQGCNLMERDDRGHLPTGTAFVDHRHYGDRDIDVDAKKHRTEPCAVWLVEWSGHGKDAGAKAFQVCADVRRHNEKGESKLKKRSGAGSPSENDKRAKSRESARRQSELQAERRTQVTNALGAAKRNELLDYVVGSVAAAVQEFGDLGFKERVAEALGITLPVVESRSGGVRVDTEALAAFGSQSDTNRLRLAAAVLVVQMEQKVEKHTVYSVEHQAAVHFSWLAERGVVSGDDHTVRVLTRLGLVEDGSDDVHAQASVTGDEDEDELSNDDLDDVLDEAV